MSQKRINAFQKTIDGLVSLQCNRHSSMRAHCSQDNSNGITNKRNIMYNTVDSMNSNDSSTRERSTARTSWRNILVGLIGAGVVLGFCLLPAPWQTNAGAEPGSGRSHSQPQESPSPGLTTEDIRTILDQAEAAANATRSALRAISGVPQTTRMHIAIVDRDGRLLSVRSMSDAWVGSYDIAIAKARTATFFSSNENAL